MKHFPILCAVLIWFTGSGVFAGERRAGEFRGILEDKGKKYGVTLSHDVPKDLKRNERVKYHITLEQGCQIYSGSAMYTPGKMLITAESIYLREGEVEQGIGHYDQFQMQCDIDPKGIINEVRLILPDGTIHKLGFNMTTPPDQ